MDDLPDFKHSSFHKHYGAAPARTFADGNSLRAHSFPSFAVSTCSVSSGGHSPQMVGERIEQRRAGCGRFAVAHFSKRKEAAEP